MRGILGNPLISIVVPMFNSEKYIERTIDSIFNQTYSNWEIIIVDDGSTDNSAELVKTKIKNIDNAKYIYQNNAGAPSARNNGLKNSKGLFILFFDADDNLENNALEIYSENIKNNDKVDILISDFSYIDNKDNIIEPGQASFDDALIKQIISNSFNNKTEKYKKYSFLSSLPGNKLIRKSFLVRNNIQYYDVKIGQDLNFYLKILGYSPNINFIDETTMYYRIHDNSISSTYSDSIVEIIKSLEEIGNMHFELYKKNPEILATHKFNHYSDQLYKVLRIDDYSEKKVVGDTLSKALVNISLEDIDRDFLKVKNMNKLKFAIKFNKIYSSEMFSKIYLKLSKLKNKFK